MAIELVTDDEQPDSWSIHIDPDVRLVELAALLAGIAARVTVEFIERGSAGQRGAIVRPVDIGAPKPTPEQIRDILQHGVPSLPKLRIVARRA
jgi:hypothetical protein